MMNDDSIIDFGKHNGKKLRDVPASYLLWALDTEWVRKSKPKLIEYIRENKDALEKESSEDNSNEED